MNFEKKVLKNLEKCYSIAPLTFHGKHCFLVAAEKHSACYLFDENGKYLDTVWEEPGGVMTMVQLPGRDGEFLATHRFYSPNDSQSASLVYVRHETEKGWVVRELIKLPFVHRFDIFQTEDSCYLLACTLKSDHQYKDDWRFPGKIYVGKLPENLADCCDKKQFELTVLKENLLKNHGYTRCIEDKIQTGIISCENGIFQVYPPRDSNSIWTVKELLEIPASDTIKLDLDGDGTDELFVFTPFHGDTIQIYHQYNDDWKMVYEHPQKLEMLHAIDCGTIDQKKCIYFGYRKQERKLMCLYYDVEKKKYQTETIDEDCGPANIHFFTLQEKECLIAANREIDEIALYINKS